MKQGSGEPANTRLPPGSVFSSVDSLFAKEGLMLPRRGWSKMMYGAWRLKCFLSEHEDLRLDPENRCEMLQC